jgi:hypothetical protein
MLFSTEEKNMLVGAFTAGTLDAVLEGYWAYRWGSGYDIAQHPEDPAYFLYANFNYWIPNLSDLIPLVGIPALLYFLGKRKRSSKLKAMGLGAAVYGLSEIIGMTALKLSATAAGMSYRVVAGGNNVR